MKTWTQLDNNIRIDVLTPSIIQAQDIYIQDCIGTKFYNKLKTGVLNTTLTTDENSFLTDYIGPCLIQYALYLVLPNLKYKFVEKGILNGTSEETQPTTLDEMKWLRETALDTAQFYNQRLLEFLKDNPGLFPEYANPGVDGMQPNRSTPYFSGLQTNIPSINKSIHGEYGTNCSECN
jgi:hypothetical protein